MRGVPQQVVIGVVAGAFFLVAAMGVQQFLARRELRQEIRGLKDSLEVLERERDRLSETIRRDAERMKSLAGDAGELRERVRALTAEREALRGERDSLRTNLEELRAEKQRADEQARQLRREMFAVLEAPEVSPEAVAASAAVEVTPPAPEAEAGGRGTILGWGAKGRLAFTPVAELADGDVVLLVAAPEMALSVRVLAVRPKFVVAEATDSAPWPRWPEGTEVTITPRGGGRTPIDSGAASVVTTGSGAAGSAQGD